jgi:hypothetical protein
MQIINSKCSIDDIVDQNTHTMVHQKPDQSSKSTKRNSKYWLQKTASLRLYPECQVVELYWRFCRNIVADATESPIQSRSDTLHFYKTYTERYTKS